MSLDGEPALATSSSQLQTALEAERAKVEVHEFELTKQELQYDERAWDVYTRKVLEYDLRVLHLKDEWLHKRYSVVKQAATAFLDQRVSVLPYPEKCGPGTALELSQAITKEGDRRMKQLNCQTMATNLSFCVCFPAKRIALKSSIL